MHSQWLGIGMLNRQDLVAVPLSSLHFLCSYPHMILQTSFQCVYNYTRWPESSASLCQASLIPRMRLSGNESRSKQRRLYLYPSSLHHPKQSLPSHDLCISVFQSSMPAETLSPCFFTCGNSIVISEGYRLRNKFNIDIHA